MRILGFQILRTARHDAFVKRHNDIIDLYRHARYQVTEGIADAQSLRRTIGQLEQDIEALKIKCSRVNVSKLENFIEGIRLAARDTNGLYKVLELLQGEANAKDMRDSELPDAGEPQADVLQGALVHDAGQPEIGNSPDISNPE